MSAAESIDIETLRAMARLGGFEWTTDVLESLGPDVARMLRALAALETVLLGEREPTVHYRIL
jgi:hypothetical protein